MTHNEKMILRDIGAFIIVAIAAEKVSFRQILATVSHDIFGIMEDKPCFKPKTSGYMKLLKQSKDFSPQKMFGNVHGVN